MLGCDCLRIDLLHIEMHIYYIYISPRVTGLDVKGGTEAQRERESINKCIEAALCADTQYNSKNKSACYGLRLETVNHMASSTSDGYP